MSSLNTNGSANNHKMKSMLEKVPLVVGFWLATHAVNAQDLNVTRFNDDSLPGSLRSAISTFNGVSDPANDRIVLSAGTYSLTYGGGFAEDFNANGDLDINNAAYGTLTIEGVGAGATIIDAATLGDRVFDIRSKTVIFKNLTIRGGRAAPSGSSGYGGGIRSSNANITLDGVVLENNTAIGYGGPAGATGVNNFDFIGTGDAGGLGSDAYGATGGGLYFEGANTLTISNSTLRGNVARGGNGGAGGTGGTGYFGGAGGTGGRGGFGLGGGIFIAGGTVTIANSTINGNSANGGDGGRGGAGGATIASFAGAGGAGGSGVGQHGAIRRRRRWRRRRRAFRHVARRQRRTGCH